MILDIIIPFYNPSKNLLMLLEKNIDHLKHDNVIEDFKIILVNDGSTEDTYKEFIPNFIEKYSKFFTFINLDKNIGKGGAIKAGLRQSTSDFAVYYDIDFPFGIYSLYHLYDRLMLHKSKLVIAVRDFSYYSKLPVKRKIISVIVKIIINTLSKGKIKDSQAGLKGMSKDIIPVLLETKANSFIMDFEFLMKAFKKKIEVDYIYVVPNEDIEFTNFSFKTIKRETIKLLKIIFNLKR